MSNEYHFKTLTFPIFSSFFSPFSHIKKVMFVFLSIFESVYVVWTEILTEKDIILVYPLLILWKLYRAHACTGAVGVTR